MPWQEKLAEYRKSNDDHDDVMSLSAEERILVTCALFAENDEKIISTFPPNLSKREVKKRLYLGRYGEELPADFFKDKE